MSQPRSCLNQRRVKQSVLASQRASQDCDGCSSLQWRGATKEGWAGEASCVSGLSAFEELKRSAWDDGSGGSGMALRQLVSPHFEPQSRSGTGAACMPQPSPVPAQHPGAGIPGLWPAAVFERVIREALRRGTGVLLRATPVLLKARGLTVKLLDNGAWGSREASAETSGRRRSSQPGRASVWVQTGQASAW